MAAKVILENSTIIELLGGYIQNNYGEVIDGSFNFVYATVKVVDAEGFETDECVLSGFSADVK